MPKYTLIVQIPNAGNKEFRYTLNLPSGAADAPSDYFRKPENRAKLKADIEAQSARQVTDADLEVFIKEWCVYIRQGLSPTTVSLDLPPLIGTPTSTPSPTPTPVPDRDRLRDNQRTSAGSNSHVPPVKTANPPEGSRTSTGGQSQSSDTGNTQPPKEEIPNTETLSTTNKQPF
jgi:hypothetical protein